MKEKYDYFEEFIKDSNYIMETAQILDDTLRNFGKEKLEANIKIVHKIENEADHLLHKMLNYLMQDFIPPLEREDIGLIMRTLDDIIDFIDELMMNFNIYNIETIREDALQFSELFIQASKYIHEMFLDLKNIKKKNNIKEKIIAINELEDKGDVLFEKVMKELYKNSKDPIEIIKWTNMYTCLENAMDACEHISDCIEDVLMKQL